MSGNRLGKGSHVAPDMRRNAEGPAYHWKVSPVGDRGYLGKIHVGEEPISFEYYSFRRPSESEGTGDRHAWPVVTLKG